MKEFIYLVLVIMLTPKIIWHIFGKIFLKEINNQ